ncbi:hypothetical protein [Hymenobacter antarcticus]|uniref:Uncharacterized protein n=1 Tax=Hymenobacter antarcticus TaxID=486270 RepID=A0ABP7PJL3_9BACT
MHFYLPRRHRRRLLFPPGLLALAGLLWLGCWAMRPWQEQLKGRNVIQLTMPVTPRGDQPSLRYEVPNPAKVCKTCSWHDARFTGNRAADRRAQIQITQYVHDIKADTMHAGGMRVQLAPTARYESFVFLLNLMLEKNIKKYWVDFTRSPTVFYAITDAYKPIPPELSGCFLCNDVINYQPPLPVPVSLWVRFDNQVTEFWQLHWVRPLLQAFQQPEWRASLWLLAAIAALSSWRLFQFRHSG